MEIDYAGWERLTRLVSDIEAALASELQARHGLGLTEYKALEYLSTAENSELRMQDLASLLGLKHSSVSRLVDKLERLGFAARDICPDDKRGIYSVITDAGREKFSHATSDYKKHLGKTLNNHKISMVLSRIGD